MYIGMNEMLSNPNLYRGQVARRSLFLALIGIALGSVDVNWQTVRLPGVLQRLAGMYLLAGALECACMKTTQTITPGNSESSYSVHI